MKNYLGEFPVNVSEHENFKNYTKEDWALLFIFMYGQIDGAHHKQWVLDQVTRILNDAPVTVVEARWDNGHSEYRYRVETSEKYKLWVAEYKGDADEDGWTEYSYDEGIAP